MALDFVIPCKFEHISKLDGVSQFITALPPLFHNWTGLSFFFARVLFYKRYHQQYVKLSMIIDYVTDGLLLTIGTLWSFWREKLITKSKKNKVDGNSFPFSFVIKRIIHVKKTSYNPQFPNEWKQTNIFFLGFLFN